MTARVKVTTLHSTDTRPLQLGRGYQRLLIERGDADNLDVHVNVLKVGSGLGPYHYHERSENIYIVLSGTIEAIVDGKRFILRKDDVALIPPGTPHSAGNVGEVEALAIEIYAPPRGTDYHVLDDPTRVEDAPASAREGHAR